MITYFFNIYGSLWFFFCILPHTTRLWSDKKKKPHTHTHNYTITNLIPILYTPITEEVKDLCLEKLEKLRRRTELVIFFSSGQTV